MLPQWLLTRVTHLPIVLERSAMRLRKERLEDSHPRAIMALLAVRAKQEEVAPVDIVVTDAVTYDIFPLRWLRCAALPRPRRDRGG